MAFDPPKGFRARIKPDKVTVVVLTSDGVVETEDASLLRQIESEQAVPLWRASLAQGVEEADVFRSIQSSP